MKKREDVNLRSAQSVARKRPLRRRNRGNGKT
jgi:hypothetical protein